MEVKYKKQQ